MRVKIVAIPPGNAPVRIRMMWIGVSFDTVAIDGDGSFFDNVPREGHQNIGGYTVLARDAIKALRDAGKNKAASYWSSCLRPNDSLVFTTEVCEIVTN